MTNKMKAWRKFNAKCDKRGQMITKKEARTFFHSEEKQPSPLLVALLKVNKYVSFSTSISLTPVSPV